MKAAKIICHVQDKESQTFNYPFEVSQAKEWATGFILCAWNYFGKRSEVRIMTQGNHALQNVAAYSTSDFVEC